MRPFFELLPYRVEQALPIPSWRASRTRRARARSSKGSPLLLPLARPRLFIDMAVISGHDAGTGIQRVVRELALALIGEGAAQWDIQFVSARRKKRYFHISWPDKTALVQADEMRANPGDVFLGLDYSLDAVRRHRRQLARFRRDGGALWFLVHDLLPLQRPDWFSRNTVIRYKAWLGVLSGLADGFLCNSAQTEAELKDALASQYDLTAGYRTQVLPMGYAIPRVQAEAEEAQIAMRFDPAHPFVLMVGTLEPRKGHADILAAFDRIWSAKGEEQLVLVGRMGWQVDALRDLILTHPLYGSKLLWFDDVEDDELFRIYDACSGVIIASLGEGFGLPLIEALGHGKPVLARDLPVFRVHESSGVHFFPTEAPSSELAGFVEAWLRALRKGTIAVVRPTQDWRESAVQLLAAISR